MAGHHVPVGIRMSANKSYQALSFFMGSGRNLCSATVSGDMCVLCVGIHICGGSVLTFPGSIEAGGLYCPNSEWTLFYSD